VRVCATCDRRIQRVTPGGSWHHFTPATHPAVLTPLEPAAAPEPDEVPTGLRFRCPHCLDETHPEPANHHDGTPRHYTRFCATCGGPVLQLRPGGLWYHHNGSPAPGHGPHVATLRPLDSVGRMGGQCTTCSLPVQLNPGGTWFHMAGAQDHAAVVIAAPVQPSDLVSPEVFAADVPNLGPVEDDLAAVSAPTPKWLNVLDGQYYMDTVIAAIPAGTLARPSAIFDVARSAVVAMLDALEREGRLRLDPEPPAEPERVEDVTDKPYQWRDQTVRLGDVERWLMRTRDEFVDNDDVIDSWNEGAYDSLDILIGMLRDHDGVPPADAEVPTGPPVCGRPLGRSTYRCARPPGHPAQCDDDPPTDPLDARVLPAALSAAFDIDGDPMYAADATRNVIETLRLAGFAVTRTGARPVPAAPAADAVVSLSLDGDRVRLTNEGTGTVQAQVGRQRAMLQHADSIGVAVPVPTPPAPAAGPERVKPADDLLTEERVRVLSVALDTTTLVLPSDDEVLSVINSLDEQGWTVVPYLTAQRFAAVRVDQLAAQVATRLPVLFGRTYDGETETFAPLTAQRTADLIEQVMRCALTECGELIDPGSAISLEVPEVPTARSTALAEAVRTAVGEAVNAITGGASANGGGSSPTPPASVQPTRDRDHDDKPHQHDHPFGNPGGHHHHDHTHSPDLTPPTAPGWYEFDQHRGWRLLFSLTPTAPGRTLPGPEGEWAYEAPVVDWLVLTNEQRTAWIAEARRVAVAQLGPDVVRTWEAPRIEGVGDTVRIIWNANPKGRATDG
jgi:hypothetical protein